MQEELLFFQNKNIPEFYRLPDDLKNKNFSGNFTKWQISGSVETKTVYEFLDTLDGVLYKHNIAFFMYKNSFGKRCYTLFYKQKQYSGLWEREDKQWLGISDLPSIIQNKIHSILKLRKVFTSCKILLHDTTYSINHFSNGAAGRIHKLNLSFLMVREGKKKQIPDIIAWEFLEKYKKKSKTIINHFGLLEKIPEFYRYLIECSEIDFEKYSIINGPELKSKMPHTKAILLLFQKFSSQLAVMESAVIRDIDIDCLHDYRVTVRKLRTLIGELKQNIASEHYKYIKKELVWINHITSTVRDLDVHLQMADLYRSLLSKKLLPSFENFYQWMQDRRNRSFKTLVKELQSERNAVFVNFLTKNKIHLIKLKKLSLDEYLSSVIQKRALKIFKKSISISKNKDAARIHNLRKEIKKIRYLLEYFVIIEPNKKNIERITIVKRFQDFLGAYNDKRIQNETLESFMKEYISEVDEKAERYRREEIFTILKSYTLANYVKYYDQIEKETIRYIKNFHFGKNQPSRIKI